MLELLARVGIFRNLPSDSLRRLLELGRPRTFRAGSHLLRQGQTGDSMYVILSGVVRLERADAEHPNEPLVLAELGPGEVVGELGLLDGEPRSATATAVRDAEALEVGRAALSEIVMQYPAVTAALLRVLSRRLRTADELADRLKRDSGSPRPFAHSPFLPEEEHIARIAEKHYQHLLEWVRDPPAYLRQASKLIEELRAALRDQPDFGTLLEAPAAMWAVLELPHFQEGIEDSARESGASVQDVLTRRAYALAIGFTLGQLYQVHQVQTAPKGDKA